MFHKKLVLAVMLFSVFSVAHADETLKRAKVKVIITLTKPDSLMEQKLDQAVANAEKSANALRGDRPMTEADRKILDQYSRDIRAIVAGAIGWPKLKAGYIDSYAAAYTEEEIDGILAFYTSPIGRAMLAKSSEIANKLSEIEGKNLQDIGPQLHKLTNKMASQLAEAHSTENH